MIRRIGAYAILFLGLVLGFALFFAIIAAAATFLGVGWAVAAFVLQVSGVTCLLFHAFGDDEAEEAGDQWTAPEGHAVNAVPMRGRVS